MNCKWSICFDMCSEMSSEVVFFGDREVIREQCFDDLMTLCVQIYIAHLFAKHLPSNTCNIYTNCMSLP